VARKKLELGDVAAYVIEAGPHDHDPKHFARIRVGDRVAFYVGVWHKGTVKSIIEAGKGEGQLEDKRQYNIHPDNEAMASARVFPHAIRKLPKDG